MKVVLTLLLLCFFITSHANEACVSYYTNKFTKSFSQYSPKIQLFRNQGFIFKIFKLAELKPEDSEYKIARQYLDETYPTSLQKDGDFKEKIKESNNNLWSQMHLLLVFQESSGQKPIAGSAFISARNSEQKLGFEDELNLNAGMIMNTPFQPSTEVGRLSVDSTLNNKRKVLDAMLDTLYLMHQATQEIGKIYIYTSRKLHQLYAIKGLHFTEITSLSSNQYINENDVIAVFQERKK